MADQFEFGIKLDADTRQANDMAESLEDVNSALDDAGKADLSGTERELSDTGAEASDVEKKLRDAFEAGQKGSDKARLNNREFNGILRETRRYAEQTGQSLEDAFADIQQGARDAGIELEDHTLATMERMGQQGPDELDKVKAALRGLSDESDAAADSVEDDARRMGDAFDDNQITPQDIFQENLRAELVSNFSEAGAEVVRGFKDGFDSEDIETIVDGLSDTVFAIGAAGGPMGMAAGAAGAAAIQLFAGPFLEEAEINAAQAEEIFSSAFDAIVENGAEMGRDLAMQAATDALVQDAERFAEAQDIAAASGADLAIVIRALAGDQDALALVQDEATSKQDALRDALAASRDEVDRYSRSTGAMSEEEVEAREKTAELARALETLEGRSDNATGALNDATAAAQAKADVDEYATRKAIENAEAQAQQTGEAQDLTVKLDGVSTAIRVMPDGKIINVDDKDSSKKTQRKIDKITGTDVPVIAYADTASADRARQDLVNRVGRISVPVSAAGFAGARAGSFYG